MESKLLVGGGNIVDHTNEQQRALEQRRKEIAEQKVSSYILSCIQLIAFSVIFSLTLSPLAVNFEDR